MRAVGTEEGIVHIVGAKLLRMGGILLVAHIGVVHAEGYIHLLHLIGLVRYGVGEGVAIQRSLLVAEEHDVLQVLALAEYIVANLHRGVAYDNGFDADVIVEGIVGNPCHTPGQDYGLQLVEHPEHVFGNLVIVLYIVIRAVAVEADVIGVGADGGLVEV